MTIQRWTRGASSKVQVPAGVGVPLTTFPGEQSGVGGLFGLKGVIGWCSGGRQSVLSACRIDLDAAVDCYGAFVTGTPPADYPLRVTNLADELPNLRAPLLGLFGADDKSPSPEQVDELSRILTEHGKSFEMHSYPDAAHAFFAVDRPSYRVAAANDGWEKIAAFFAAHLTSPRTNTVEPFVTEA